MLDSPEVITSADLLGSQPEPIPVTAQQVLEARQGAARTLIVLDDDPTGTQSVADLPVLTSWDTADLAWALKGGAPAVYVMTNSRSLDPDTAAARNHEVAANALAAATEVGVEIDFVSRSDSTLRGHYPLEPDVLAEEMDRAGITIDGVIIVPAFADAGRVTVDSVHYAGSTTLGFTPVGQTEFAQDATFGYAASNLTEWVAEKTQGRFAAQSVAAITLTTLRSGPQAVADVLQSLTDASPVVVDIAQESDLRVLALGILAAEAKGKRFIHRVGPPFVRALVGQDIVEPLTSDDCDTIREGGKAQDAAFGLIVVGSHVSMTTKQLDALRARHQPTEIEIDVAQALGDDADAHLDDVVARALEGLADGNVIIRTSRTLVTGNDGASSLDIARTVSDAVVHTVQAILASQSLRFVIAKGGITSSDVASRGLSITRAICRGPMLPGIVSLWEPTEGPAQGIPYIVFAGNVGTEDSLADVVDKLSA